MYSGILAGILSGKVRSFGSGAPRRGRYSSQFIEWLCRLGAGMANNHGSRCVGGGWVGWWVGSLFFVGSLVKICLDPHLADGDKKTYKNCMLEFLTVTIEVPVTAN